MSKRKDERWTNRRFFSILKELESSKHLLNTEQTRLLERSINFCVLNGLHFNEAEYTVCTELNNKIQDQQSFFKQRLNYANKIFELRLSESMPLDEIPLKIKSMVSIDRLVNVFVIYLVCLICITSDFLNLYIFIYKIIICRTLIIDFSL